MQAGSAAAQLRAGVAALAFLTCIPVGRRLPLDAGDVARGALLFPVVGAGVGAAVGLTAMLLHPSLPALPSAALALAVGLLLTGAIHLDGLADTADALGGRSRAEALAIMRDHALGTYGVAALVIDLLTKAGAVAVLLERDDVFIAFLVAGALSRAAVLPLASALPYARADVGPGGVLGQVGVRSALVGAALAATAALGLLGARGGWMLLAVALTTLLLGVAYRRWLGGVTGDTLGAASELSETLALVVAVAVA
jgi:adenosylcobinamide-GDP ribazoletransferase